MSELRHSRTVPVLICAFLVLTAGWAMAQQGRDDQTQAQAAALDRAQRAVLAEKVVAEKEAVMGRELDQSYRRRYAARLASSLSQEQLEVASYSLSSAPMDLGDSGADLVFTPVTPCRIIDTRLAGGVMAGGTTRNFHVAGATGFAAQGGAATGCGIPLGPATAAIINFVAVTPTGPGNLRAYAYNSPAPTPPTAVVLNYAADPNFVAIINGTAVPLCDTAAGMTCTYDMIIKNDVSTTHVVADVVGYFRAAVHDVQGMVLGYAYVNAGGTLGNSWMATGGTPSVSHPGTGEYLIAWPGENVYFSDTPVFITPLAGNTSVSFTSFGGGAQTGVFLKNPATAAAVDNAFWVMILQDHNP